MAFLKFFFLLALAPTLAQASLYKCEDPDGKPVYAPTKQTIQVHKNAAKPYVLTNAKERLPADKKPFLIYYTVDSLEPFMQLAVKYEVSRLKETCLASKDVNFVAMINSLYVAKNEIILCKDQTFENVSLSKFPALDLKLKNKIKFMGAGDHTDGELGPMQFLVMYDEVANKSFPLFPLAHPDFLYDLMELAITDTMFFPSEKYVPFLHLKSHGNADSILSGLHPCQTASKIASQELVFKDSNLTAEQIDTLMNGEGPEHLKLLERYNLGEKLGIGKKGEMGEHGVGEHGVGEHGVGIEGMGDIVSGLGADEGLGTSAPFGSVHISLNGVLARLFSDRSGRVLGFVMIEACETNRDYSFNDGEKDNVLGFYSAKNSLWYRNLNWWTIMEKAGGSPTELFQLLETTTASIQNFEVIP